MKTTQRKYDWSTAVFSKTFTSNKFWGSQTIETPDGELLGEIRGDDLDHAREVARRLIDAMAKASVTP